MPKNDTLRRMDESQRSNLLIERDTIDPTATTTPNVPSGVSVKSVPDGILIDVNFYVDTAHLHPRFQSFIVYARRVGDSDTDGHEIGRFSDSDFMWQPDFGGYTGWNIALSAISNTGLESDKTSWYSCVLSTLYDNFSEYGGDETTEIDDLYWLKIADFDSDENWESSTGTQTNETTTMIEGDRAIKNVVGLVGFDYLADSQLDVSLDLSSDGRFGDDDFVTIPIYVPASTLGVSIRFYDTYPANAFRYTNASLVSGWNYLEPKKSDFIEEGTPSWSSISKLGIYGAGQNASDYFIVDDWRVSKYDPSASAAFNDTGDTWDFNGGLWHIYAGNRDWEPNYAYSLGQVSGAGACRYLAWRPDSNMPNNKLSSGIYFRGPKNAGVAFRIEDTTPGAETMLTAELDNTNDTVSLVRYESGSRTVLSSSSFTISAYTQYHLGVDYRDVPNTGRIRVYASTDLYKLFDGNSRILSYDETATWPNGFMVGLISEDTNVRFSEFRAGSPQTADYAERSGVATDVTNKWQDWTPAIYQGDEVTVESACSRYTIIGNTAHVQARVKVGSSGSSGCPVSIEGMPSTITPCGLYLIGSIWVRDIGTAWYAGALHARQTSASWQGVAHNETNYIGTDPSFGLAASDMILICAVYEV